MECSERLSFTAVLFAVACASDAPPPTDSFRVEVDTVAGVETVTSYGEPPEWTLDTLFSLGGAAATDTTEQFGRVISVVSDADGHLFLADQMLSTVREFDETGAYVGTVGRQGQGPGEYQRPIGIALLGDTLMVVDPGNVRIGLFWHGEWQGQSSYPAISGSGTWAYQTGAAEAVIRSYRVLPSGGETVLIRYGPDGPGDTVQARPQLEFEVTEPDNAIECRSPQLISFYEPPFAPRSLRAPASGGWVVESEPIGYRLFFLEPNGDTARIVERLTDEILIDEEEWETAVADYEEWQRELSGMDCNQDGLERQRRARMVERMYPDRSGRLWVERYVRHESPESVFDVFAPDGALLATVRSPRLTSRATPFFDEDRIYVVSADSMDVETVWGLRVSGP